MEIMAILKSKILDLERLEQLGQARVREERTTYALGESLGEPLFPFGPEDYE
jgi:hypothetical protein